MRDLFVGVPDLLGRHVQGGLEQTVELTLGGGENHEALAQSTLAGGLDLKNAADCYSVICERFDNLPWVMGVVPKGESDEKVQYDKIADLLKTTEAKCILAGSEEECVSICEDYLNTAAHIAHVPGITEPRFDHDEGWGCETKALE